MLANSTASNATALSAVPERPGQTRIHPAEELNSILRMYCTGNEELSPAAIRAIGTATTKLSDCGMLNMADQEQIYQFLKIQNETLKTQIFPFDIVEIALKILAAPDMPLMLYNDQWIQNIVNNLSDLCNKVFQDNGQEVKIHRLFPIYRHLSYVVQQIHLSEPSLYKLISLSLPAYFLPSSSPPLQTASCSLMTAIFKKYPDLRIDLLSDIFGTIEKNPGAPKYVTFPNDTRRTISAVTRIFLELSQSISSFPCDTESDTNDIIQAIIQRFAALSKSSAIMGRIFEKFVEDISLLITHPFYPISSLILKTAIEALFPSISKKDENTRIAIKLICTSLAGILKCAKRNEQEAIIVFPMSVLSSLTYYSEEFIKQHLSDPESNIVESENGSCALRLGKTFPLNTFEELVSRFIVVLYLQQTMKLDVINTSLQFSISLWSMKKLSQEETDNYLLWWRGMLPSNINFEWTLDIAELICLHDICRQTMFTHVYFLIQHLLKGLENKSSNVRSQILRGLSNLIEIDPDLLFHSCLVPQIQNAFQDPSAPIRDSVLQILSKYIFQNEQSSSPYFNVVINCLADPSPMVVKRALSIVGELSKSSDEECLAKLCYLLSTKLNDESTNVAKAARDAFIQVLFEDSSNPTHILVYVVSNTKDRPVWFSKFFKTLYLKPKYTASIKNMINQTFEILNEAPSYQAACLIREFCATFPKLCAPQHEVIISIVNTCNDDNVLLILPDAISSILSDISNPNITLFNLQMESVRRYVYSKPAPIIRSMIRMSSIITSEIVTTSTTLNAIFEHFMKFLRENLKISKQKEFVETPESLKLVSHLCRALFISGCICRYYKELTQRQINQIWGPIQFYFNAPIPKLRTMVLQSVCDICIRDTTQIQMAKELVSRAFKLGPPESVSAVHFLKNLIEEESKVQDTTAIDEIRPTYSSNLIHDFMSEVTECFGYNDSAMRTAVLEFSKVALMYGAINPPDIIKYIISMLCAKDQHELAIDTLKVIIYHYSSILNNRMKDGIRQSFNFVMATHENLLEIAADDYSFRIGSLLKLLPPPQQSIFLTSFTDILRDNLATKPDPLWVNWIVKSLMNFPFEYVWEVSTVILNLNNSIIMSYINSAFTDSKSIILALSDPQCEMPKGSKPPVWYASILILECKQYLVKKYQIKLKKLKQNEKDLKTPVKVAMIDPPKLDSIPLPNKKAVLDDPTLNLFAQFRTAMKMERSFHFSQADNE